MRSMAAWSSITSQSCYKMKEVSTLFGEKEGGKRCTYAVTSNNKDVIVIPHRRLSGIRGTNHKLLHRRVSQTPRYSKHTCIYPNKRSMGIPPKCRGNLTIYPIIHDESPRLLDPPGLLYIASLMIICKPNSLPSSRKHCTRIACIRRVQYSLFRLGKSRRHVID